MFTRGVFELYGFSEIEKKWQDRWYSSDLFLAKDDTSKPKYYPLIEFPYPSGSGLHVGHPRPYIALDIVARKRRMQGFNVLYCIGWDAFGLPTENYAIKNKLHPRIVSRGNIKRFKAQVKRLGISFDWSREIDTTDENYYKWTQWIFLQLFKKGLAYKSEAMVNWCTGCKVVLANEEVINGTCERCASEVVKKQKNQWMLRITKYAQRLIDDLDDVDYPYKVKTSQINWIGRSEGANMQFKTTAGDLFEVFTTRPDTIYGVTYIVIAPEHQFVQKWLGLAENATEVKDYVLTAARKTDIERTDLNKDKTGIQIKGIYAVNPINQTHIPIWVSDYVLTSYGTGVVMAVPAHDTRDFEFAKKYSLPIIDVVSSDLAPQEPPFTGKDGTIINSEMINGLSVADAREAVIKWLEENGLGRRSVNFKLRDWVFSRQRYWGEPIPIVNCPRCGYVPISESELPLRLPDIESFQQAETGESPLANVKSWVDVKCPECGSDAQRETDTMPQWAGSSWYFLRYCDPFNDRELISQQALKYWMPVDWYNGGMEHTTLHLLYSRFWHKFLYDIGVVHTKEPYAKRTSHGMILGENNEKMSKSRGNVVNPDDVLDQYGADTMRLYEMFIGDFESAASWDTNSIKGCSRFLERVFGLPQLLVGEQTTDFSSKLRSIINKTIKKVSADIEVMKFNTAIASLMSLLNEIYAVGELNRFELKIFLLLLCVFAPHISEEVWERCGFDGLACVQSWPGFCGADCQDSVVEIAVQVNGRIKTKILLSPDTKEEEAFRLAKENAIVRQAIAGGEISKEVYVPKSLINFVL
ncbi:MAG: leucine--tRNA ligase [Oscillospiraceae bacterium]|nr:leucine--tRNA ligase [Oscillospiraceae bacterium]